MPKLLIAILIFGTALLTGGIFYVVKNGYKPESVKILDFSQFRQPQPMGAVLFRRFWSEMQTAKIIVLGEDPHLRSGALIWDGFIEAAAAQGITFDQILSRPDLAGVAKLAETAKRVLVRADSTDVAVAQIAELAWKDALVLHQSQLVPQATDEIAKLHVCDSEKDTKLECQIQKISRQTRRKKYDTRLFAGVMEQTYPSQYVLFVSEPPVIP